MENCGSSRASYRQPVGTSVPLTLTRRAPVLGGSIETFVYFCVLCAFWGLIVFVALGVPHA